MQIGGNKDMREASIYMSELFVNKIWPDFSKDKLKNKRAHQNYYSIVCMLCDNAKSDFLDLSPALAQSYFDSLTTQKPKKRRIALSTIQSRLSAMRSISSYILENREKYDISTSYTNVFLFIDIPPLDENVKREDIPTVKELNDILISSSEDAMMFLIFSMVIRCGFAASEICKMKVSQICEDAANNFSVTFHEKNRTRYVKLPEDVVMVLLDYRRFIKVSQEYMFYNKKGHVLKVRNLETLVRKYVSLAGVSKYYTIQDIRNAAVCYMKASGADDISIANFIGIEARWMYRYDYVVKELDMQPVDLVKLRILK
jgi:site-specific recombinase XerD